MKPVEGVLLVDLLPSNDFVFDFAALTRPTFSTTLIETGEIRLRVIQDWYDSLRPALVSGFHDYVTTGKVFE